MRDTMTRIARATGAVARAALWIAGAALVLMVAVVAAQVFWRYVLGGSLFWSERFAVMTMGWFIFLGAAVGIREGYHLSFDVLLHVLPERVGRLLHTVSDLVVGAFGGGMAVYGVQLMERVAGNTIPAIGISGAWEYLPLVCGGALIVLFAAERIARRLAGLATPRFGDAPEGAS